MNKKKKRETCFIFLNKCKYYDNWDISILDALQRQIFSGVLSIISLSSKAKALS